MKKGKSALSGSSASSAGPSTSARPVDSEGKVLVLLFSHIISFGFAVFHCLGNFN